MGELHDDTGRSWASFRGARSNPTPRTMSPMPRRDGARKVRVASKRNSSFVGLWGLTVKLSTSGIATLPRMMIKSLMSSGKKLASG